MPQFTVPGYRYLGPGNDTFSGDEPINEADATALIHDLDYSFARNNKDIHWADYTALSRFKQDWNRTKSLGSLLGLIGLGAKYGVESVFGTLYPLSMPDRKKALNFGQILYAERVAAQKKAFDELPRGHEFVNFHDFVKRSPYAKQISDKYIRGGQEYRRLQGVHNTSFQKRPADTPIAAEPAEKRTDTGAGHAGPSYQTDPEPGPSRPDTSLSPGTNAAIDEALRASESSDLPDTGLLDPNLPTGTSQAMDVDPGENTSGTGRGASSGARGGASGGLSGGPIWIRPSATHANGVAEFHKSRIMFSWGYSSENIQSVLEQGTQKDHLIDHFTTSLALVPVDFLPFYLSEAEYLNLPYGSRVVKVWCTITSLGTRTAFEMGGTSSGTATSEYVPIGLVAEGLNKKLYGRNYTYNTTSTKPMVPAELERLQVSPIVKRYYDSVRSNVMLNPTAMNEYYTHEWNRSGNPDDSKYPEYMIHDKGVVRADNLVHQFLINNSIGQEIAHYEYEPKLSFIRAQKEHFVPYDRRGNKFETPQSRMQSIALQFFKNNNKPALGHVGLSAERGAQDILNNQVAENYQRQLENYGAFHPTRGSESATAQPQLHVGLLPTPQLIPNSAEPTWLNSSAYWKVECGIKITYDFGSCFTHGVPISWPEDVHFVPNAMSTYTDGQTLFGCNDAQTGNLQARRHRVEEEYDCIEEELQELALTRRIRK